ncbi:MAG TPA: alpha/beta fold hydrolase [Pseudonocardiaceae bacterium]|nr:alpha/beta fold hydrolase [Pseudonocardiaceae bacterium]
MSLLQSLEAPPLNRPSLTTIPLSTVALPPLVDPMPPWPGREIDLGDLVVHVRETPGPTPGAPRAVFVHGLGGAATNWTELAAALAGDVHGIAIDLPGFGRSRPPATGDFSLAGQAGIVCRVIDRLGAGPVHLFGNSLGGDIALLVAAERPDLVRTLTLVSPAVPDLRPSLRRLSDPRVVLASLPVIGRPMRRKLAASTALERTEQMLRVCFAVPDAVSPPRLALAVEETAERMTMPWAGLALEGASRALLRTWVRPPARSLWSVARRVTVPTLVVWGSQDRVMSVRKAPRIAGLLSRGRLLVLPRTGHVAQMERPHSVARAVLGMWEAVAAAQW